MAEDTRTYCARRAAEEAERVRDAHGETAATVHRKLQRAYVERASVGDREPQREIIG
jgi:hypothetical protein